MTLYDLHIRLSRGWQKDSCIIGHMKLAKHTSFSRSTVQKAVARLIERVIENLGDRGNDGTEYSVLPGVHVLQRGIPSDGHIKNNKGSLKENNKKGNIRLTPDEIKSFTATVVDLLVEGESVKEIEIQYAPSMHPADWAAVKSVAQAAPKKVK